MWQATEERGSTQTELLSLPIGFHSKSRQVSPIRLSWTAFMAVRELLILACNGFHRRRTTILSIVSWLTVPISISAAITSALRENHSNPMKRQWGHAVRSGIRGQ